MASEPLVSVVITTYNCSQFIEETVRSVSVQTYGNIEIIIADDGSSDGTQKTIESIAAKDSRIKFIPLAHSGSPAKTRNSAIKEAKGKYVAFLDGDDVWMKDKLQLQVEKLEKESGCVLCYSMSVTFGNVNFFSPSFEVLPLIYKGAHTREDLVSKGNVITNSSVLVRRDVLNKAGGFDEDPSLRAVEDYDAWIRLGEFGNYYFIPRILVLYRIHHNQTSGSWDIKNNNLKYLAEKRNLPVPSYKFYRNKGIFIRVLRNFVHYINYLIAK